MNIGKLVRPKNLVIGAIRFYQIALSPLKMGPTCRFEPTCSTYALEATRRFGAARGLILSGIRLAKCGPWHPGGYDPVPGNWPVFTNHKGV